MTINNWNCTEYINVHIKTTQLLYKTQTPILFARLSKTRVVRLHLERRVTRPKHKWTDLKAAVPSTFQTGSQPETLCWLWDKISLRHNEQCLGTAVRCSHTQNVGIGHTPLPRQCQSCHIEVHQYLARYHLSFPPRWCTNSAEKKQIHYLWIAAFLLKLDNHWA